MQRNKKKTALEEFARENNLKPESIKKSYKRFQAVDRDKTGSAKRIIRATVMSLFCGVIRSH
jgi:Ca2+-binding EF-hand superfamily protein